MTAASVLVPVDATVVACSAGTRKAVTIGVTDLGRLFCSYPAPRCGPYSLLRIRILPRQFHDTFLEDPWDATMIAMSQ